MPRWLDGVGITVTLAALAVYAVMLTVTLPHLGTAAGGLAVFDLRPGGYDLATARALLTQLGDDGRHYYATVQHRLDTLFPLLESAALIYWLYRLGRRWRLAGLPLPLAVLGLLIVIAVLAGAADLAENSVVAAMLKIGPERLTPGLVRIASLFTQTKTVLVTMAGCAVLVLALGPALSRRRA